MSRFFTISFLLILFLSSCKATPPLVKVVEEMADYKTFECKFVGLSEDSSLQWVRYEQILANSTHPELIQLCENESPVVRSYAFLGLIEKKSPQIFVVLLKHIEDTGEFDRVIGCMVDPCYVSDFFLEQVSYFPFDSTGYRISPEQKEYLDSLMLFGSAVTLRMDNYNEIKLKSRAHMLKYLLPKPSYYKRLREIVLAGVIEALPALAKFQNPNDVSIIERIYKTEGLIGQYFVFDAIAEFPHSDLYYIVEREIINELHHDNGFDRLNYKFYQALIQYNTPESKELLNAVLSTKGSKNHERRVNSIKNLIAKTK